MISIKTLLSLCLPLMMISCLLLLSVLSVISVNTKINVVGSKDTLAVRVGHNILARMGKEGIEMEKMKDPRDDILRELLVVSLEKGNFGVSKPLPYNFTNPLPLIINKNEVDDDDDQDGLKKRDIEDKSRFELNLVCIYIFHIIHKLLGHKMA